LIYRWRKFGSARPWPGSAGNREEAAFEARIAGILLKLPASGVEKCIKTVLTQSIFLCAADIDHRKPS